MKKLSVFEKIQQVIDAKNITPSRAEQLCGFGVGTIAKLIERKPDIQSAKLKMIEAENRAQMKVV